MFKTTVECHVCNSIREDVRDERISNGLYCQGLMKQFIFFRDKLSDPKIVRDQTRGLLKIHGVLWNVVTFQMTRSFYAIIYSLVFGRRCISDNPIEKGYTSKQNPYDRPNTFAPRVA